MAGAGVLDDGILRGMALKCLNIVLVTVHSDDDAGCDSNHRVESRSTLQGVHTVGSPIEEKEIVSLASSEYVRSLTAQKNVVATVSEERVLASEADDQIIAFGADQRLAGLRPKN